LRAKIRAIVAGAGPGGATAALALARAGVAVSLVEKSAWPRAKTCGDGVSPLAIREGRELGLHFEGSVHLRRALVTTPREVAFRGGWPADTPWGTTIERRAFDAGIVDGAVAAGADFLPATAVRALDVRAGGVVATVVSGERERELRADVAIVADGASGVLASRLGFPAYRSRLVAIRGYADAPSPLFPEYGLFYDRLLSPGYGWIFPMDERYANVGVLVDERVLARRGGNMRELLTRWLAESRFSRAVLGDSAAVRDVRGGIIPTGRRRRTRERVLLVGDAAGVADPFTAEGIYQAILSARLAAQAIVEAPDIPAACKRYERSLAPFDANERAARALRATFDIAIGPYAQRAAAREPFADRLNTDVFFPKTSLASFVFGLARAW
jgi:geranylgeranyl reductase family protein